MWRREGGVRAHSCHLRTHYISLFFSNDIAALCIKPSIQKWLSAAAAAAICIILVACNVPRACPMLFACVCVRVASPKGCLVAAVAVNFLTTLTCRQRQLDIFYGLLRCFAFISVLPLYLYPPLSLSVPFSVSFSVSLCFLLAYFRRSFRSVLVCPNEMSPCVRQTQSQIRLRCICCKCNGCHEAHICGRHIRI